MFVQNCLDVNEQGHLTVGGVDTLSLAQQFGTPLYVMDEKTIRDNCRIFKKSIDDCYDGFGRVLYASKAMSCMEIYRIMNEEGMGVDVVSFGELYTALKAGFPADRIYFHGNNKTVDELRLALEAGVARIVVDNLTELHTLGRLAEEMDKHADIYFRIKPGIDAHTHDFVKTGQIDSKFGFAFETGEAMAAAKEAAGLARVTLKGVHCHIGSQIFDTDPFVLAADRLLTFMRDVREETGAALSELNLGGGFGIQYIASHDARPYEAFMKAVSAEVKAKAQEYGMPVPFICIEPGRSIAGPAGITLYTVGGVKTIPHVRTYVSVDGGMTDNPRYALYRSEYTVLVANRAKEPATEIVTIAGKCCESGDLIQEHTAIQPVEAGDTLAVLATGAYNYSMSSNYNRIPKPAVVMVKDGQARVIVKRETLDDIIRNDI